jgi:hypothetical protein
MTMIPKGTRCASKSVFVLLLQKWYETTAEETVGDKKLYPKITPWIFVETGGFKVRVHADTTREAVGRYLALASELGKDLPWRVRKGKQGTLNKVCIEPDGGPTKGLFMYTVKELSEPTSI